MLFVDASTLILAAKTELLDLFADMANGPAVIALEVEKEATQKKTFDALLIKQRIEDKKITIKKVKNNAMVKTVMIDFNLHKGEAETITLCLENSGAIATDDYNAMKACTVLKINYVSSLGILLQLYKQKKLNKEETKLKLEQLAKYGRFSTEILGDFNERLEG